MMFPGPQPSAPHLAYWDGDELPGTQVLSTSISIYIYYSSDASGSSENVAALCIVNGDHGE